MIPSKQKHIPHLDKKTRFCFYPFAFDQNMFRFMLNCVIIFFKYKQVLKQVLMDPPFFPTTKNLITIFFPQMLIFPKLAEPIASLNYWSLPPGPRTTLSTAADSWQHIFPSPCTFWGLRTNLGWLAYIKVVKVAAASASHDAIFRSKKPSFSTDQKRQRKTHFLQIERAQMVFHGFPAQIYLRSPGNYYPQQLPHCLLSFCSNWNIK